MAPPKKPSIAEFVEAIVCIIKDELPPHLMDWGFSSNEAQRLDVRVTHHIGAYAFHVSIRVRDSPLMIDVMWDEQIVLEHSIRPYFMEEFAELLAINEGLEIAEPL